MIYNNVWHKQNIYVPHIIHDLHENRTFHIGTHDAFIKKGESIIIEAKSGWTVKNDPTVCTKKVRSEVQIPYFVHRI